MLRFASIFVLSCAAMFAQATSQIQGVVRDTSGLPVPGAEVKATQTDTGVERSAVSGTDGNYVLSNLAIGPYRLEVSKSGFANYIQTGIVLQVATNPTIDVALNVSAVSQTVQVEANAAQVETENTSLGTVIENQRIIDLPLNGRQATDLIQLTRRDHSRRSQRHGRLPRRPEHCHRGRSACPASATSWMEPYITIRSTPPIFRSRSRMLWKNSRWRPALSPRRTESIPRPPSTRWSNPEPIPSMATPSSFCVTAT